MLQHVSLMNDAKEALVHERLMRDDDEERDETHQLESVDYHTEVVNGPREWGTS